MAGAWADLRARLQFLRNDFGGESRTREKTAPQIWLPNYKRKCCLQQEQLKQAENDFDVDAATHRLAVRPSSGTHSPVPYGRDGFLFQAQPGTLQHARIKHTPVRRDNHVQQHAALVLGFARFVRVIRIRAIDTSGLADAVDAGAKFAAARAAAGTRPETAAGSAANTCAIAVSQRITIAGRQWVAESRRVYVGYFQIRWTKERRLHLQLGIRVLNPHLRRSKLRPLELRYL